MKKSIFFCAALFACAFAFQSCDKVDNPGSPTLPQFTETTYDFAAEQALIAAGTVEKPGNIGGNQNNGQGFYGWENAGKTDSRRNDYKGYSSKEGSVLPASSSASECHIWRRADRFDQDASWNTAGGVKMPNDREFAIDGLDEGSYVQIFYEGGEIVWAIGDGSSEKLEGPRTKATINGVEAVTGETVIPSGAKIEINSVTPAVKGTGYIVFKVKRDMIISKIVVATRNYR